MASEYVKAKNFKEAHKAAMAANLPGGTMTLEVIECANLPKADSSGKIDAAVKVLFSTLENQQIGKTEVVTQNRNPKFSKGKFEFNICKANDVVTFELYDRDMFPFPKQELLAKCAMDVGEASRAGLDNEVTLYFHGLKTKPDQLDGFREDKMGTVKVKFFYDFRPEANIHASEDITQEQEEMGTMEAYKKLTDELLRITWNSGYCLTPLWYFLETCMWERPFESAFWLLFWTLSTFVFDQMLSAFFPGVLFVCMVRQYWLMATYGFKGPPQAPLPPPPTMKQLVVNTIWSLRMTNDGIEYWFEIYGWRRRDTAMLLTKGCLAWFLAIEFLPLMPAFRYWFWLGMLYMYTLYPLYYKYPRLMNQHIQLATDIAEAFSVYNLERRVYPYLPAALRAYLPASQDTLMEKEVDGFLPPLPEGPLSYQEWKRYYDEREEVKGIMELMKAGYLTDKGVPKLPQEGLKGKLHVRLISSHGFEQDAQGTADPFAKLTVETKSHVSKTKSSTMAPVWNEDFEFREVTYLSDAMLIRITDKNTFGDRLLGSSRMQLDTVWADVPRLVELPLVVPKVGSPRGGGSGHVGATVALSVRGSGPGWPNQRHSQILQKIQKIRRAQKEGELAKAPDTRTGSLKVVLVAGQGLKACDLKTSDPYVLLSLSAPHASAQRPEKSSTKESTLNPVWNEEYDFHQVNANMALNLRVFDHDTFGSNDPMGTARMPLQDLFEGDLERRSLDVMLEGKFEGQLHIRVTAHGFGRVMPASTMATPEKIKAWAARKEAEKAKEGSPSPVAKPAATPAVKIAAPTPPSVVAPSPTPVKTAPGTTPPPAVASPPAAGGGDTGSLEVTIMSARQLVSSRPSPEYYIKSQLIDRQTKQTKKFKTRPVAPGTTNPQWNVAFTYSDLQADTLQTHQLQLEVWDTQGTVPEAAGVCDMKAMAGHEAVEAWLKMFHGGKDAGEVRIKLRARNLTL